MGKNDDERGLFDHLNMIKKSKDPDYWSKLTDSERKDFSTFLIERFLSMNPSFVEIISDLKPYTYRMEDRHVYRLYAEILPYDGKYWDYVSSSNKERYPDWLVDKVRDFYEVSSKEAREYIDIFLGQRDGRERLKNILEKYGLEEKKVNRIDNLKKTG